MDRRLIRYYERELQHLRGMGTEFAREFPKIAGRLSLEEFSCTDPYVERLLEGFAFLAARVQLKLDAEFPRFTQNLLETVYPHYLAPTPSMAVVEFQPDLAEAGLAEGYVLPRETVLRTIIGPGERTACEYRTGHALKLWPVKVAEVRYYTRDVGVLDLPSVSSMNAAGGSGRGSGAAVWTPKAALRIRLTATAALAFNKIKMDELVVYLRGADATPLRLYEQLFGHARAIVARPVLAAGARVARWQEIIPASKIERVGFEPSDGLLPFDARSFQGFRLLHEYFAFPRRFLFAKLGGLAAAFTRCEQPMIDLIVVFDEENAELEGALDASSVALNCTPAINLFPKRADRIFVTERFSEFQVIPDRTRPLDFEVYRVTSVTGFGAASDELRKFKPFYSARDAESGGEGVGAYYATHRVPRTLSEREQRGALRSTYAGSEVFLSLVESSSAPYSEDLRQLGMETLCSNRDLPIQMPLGKGRTDFTLDIGAPVQAVRVVAGPTAPRASHAEPRGNQTEGEAVWRLISHLSLNYLSLMDNDPTTPGEQPPGAAAMRDVLRLYADTADAAVRKQVEGLRSVTCASISRRVDSPGPISFARGLEVTVTMDESQFEGTGVFLLGAVLERFFTGYASINSFTETVVRTLDRGEIMRWPTRIGRRPVL